MRLTFRNKLFVTAAAVGILAALVAAGLLVWSLRRDMHARIESRLLLETRLVADLLERGALPGAQASLDGEADRLGRLVGARVTFIGPDGKVVGDSWVAEKDLAAVEEHLHRPEIMEARQAGVGRARRFSATVNVEMVYIAVPVRHPQVSFVRLAAAETEIQEQLHAIVPPTLVAIGVSLPVALVLAWAFSLPLARRMRAVAHAATHYAAGDFGQAPVDYGDDELGRVARTLDGIVQDLGRRLGELARNRARMEAILAGMVEGVLVLDEQGRIQLVNDAARRLLKIDDDPTGRRHTEVVRHPDVLAQLGAALRGDEAPGVELTLGGNDRRVLFARAASARDDRYGGAVLVLHDITDLRRADQVRRDFVANVSHELRTPLTAIRGYVEALLDESPSDEAREFLQIIFRHTTRMERLVGDLLRLARLDARQETAEVSRADLSALLDAVLTELAPAIEARGTDVHVVVNDAARLVMTDQAKLHDVLKNLVENAINYAPEHGAVWVNARRDDGGTVIEVADTGPGIPPADLERVFERFYRVDKSRSRNPGGTGIGLAIVKHLVELLGGDVRASNRPEGGAVFTLHLPPERPVPAGDRARAVAHG